ncbi:hypothetical protein RJ45_09455 [Photobacterium gaetbulicola]|uniref:Uncharacterized protein n=1 Tax=Photobacterium gaetbulicola TaxID=1295392 RepID=A0A0B9G5L7_9GAMM|nr:hypothetical protein [Photobacterium gaetbulicola]KHT63914.1 hypothetical protein RJ45_09455 [Photobacterium gaetbulicola]
MNSYSVCLRGEDIGEITFSPFSPGDSYLHANVESKGNDYSFKYLIDKHSKTYEDRIGSYSNLERDVWLLYEIFNESEGIFAHTINYKKEAINRYVPKRELYDFDVFNLLSVLMFGTLAAIVFLQEQAAYTGMSRQGFYVEIPIVQTGGTRKHLRPAEYRWCLSERYVLKSIHSALSRKNSSNAYYLNKYNLRKKEYTERCTGWIRTYLTVRSATYNQLLPHYDSIAKEELSAFFNQ